MDKVAGNFYSIIRDSETALKWAFQRKTGAAPVVTPALMATAIAPIAAPCYFRFRDPGTGGTDGTLGTQSTRCGTVYSY